MKDIHRMTNPAGPRAIYPRTACRTEALEERSRTHDEERISLQVINKSQSVPFP